MKDQCSESTSSQDTRSGVAGGLIAVTVALLLLRPVLGRATQDTFTAYFLGITLSATPYVLLGAALSGIIEVFLPPLLLVRLTQRLGLFGVPVTALVAPLFPICECGIVAVTRSLLRKGLPLHYALTYLLAAPILNPIVFFSTYMAFQDLRHAIFRLLGGFLVAVGIGLAFSRVKPEFALLPEFLEDPDTGDDCGCGGEEEAPRTARSLASDVLRRMREDFLDMMPYLLMGVFIASAMKTFMGDTVLSWAGASPVLGAAVMMLLAFVLSLCSEADAFPAASFTTFSLTAHMGFLVLGPLLDIKLLLMYRSVFRTRFIVLFSGAIVLGVALYVLLLGLVL